MTVFVDENLHGVVKVRPLTLKTMRVPRRFLMLLP